MRICKTCGYLSDGNEVECPYCGDGLYEKSESASKSSDGAAHAAPVRRSVFAKYADLMDDDTLYRTALIKLASSDSRDVAEGADMLRALAFRGHCDGMYRYAEYLLALDAPDEKTAVMWLKIAAGAGHSQSKLRLRVLGAKDTADKPITIPGDASEFVERVRSALPSVVSILTAFGGKGGKTMYSAGSGFIVEGGYVLTNAHVVTVDPKSITARFEPSLDDRTYNLAPLAIDAARDIAVLKFTGLKNERVSAQDNLPLRMGDLQYGEEVYTIGNPLGLGLSVSRGVISCPNRATDYPTGIDHVVQTDISANHGNSGGALLDANNNVVGMITFLPGDTQGGIAMCVPSDYIVQALNNLK